MWVGVVYSRSGREFLSCSRSLECASRSSFASCFSPMVSM